MNQKTIILAFLISVSALVESRWAMAQCSGISDCVSCAATLTCVWCPASGACLEPGVASSCPRPVYLTATCRSFPPTQWAPSAPTPPVSVEVTSCQLQATGFWGRGRSAFVQLINTSSEARAVTLHVVALYPGGGTEIAASTGVAVGARSSNSVQVPFRPRPGMTGIRCEIAP